VRIKAEDQETRGRLLAAAARLFAERGFAKVTVRDICRRARANVAAVNYHFGSKDALFEAVFMRRLAPLIASCLAELDELEAREEKLSVESLVTTFIRPCLALSKDPARGGALFVRLLSRTLVENHRLLRETISQQYSVFVQRYSRAFHHALPELGVEELAWRMHFAFSVMFNAFAGNDVLKIFTRSQIVSARDPDMIVKYLVPFVVAGLVSPVKG